MLGVPCGGVLHLAKAGGIGLLLVPGLMYPRHQLTWLEVGGGAGGARHWNSAGQQPSMFTWHNRVMTHPGDCCPHLRAGTLGHGNRDRSGGIPQGHGDGVWSLNYPLSLCRPDIEKPEPEQVQIFTHSENSYKTRCQH